MFLLGTTVAMKNNLIKKIILNNKILILIFILLIACDSGGDSNQNSEESMPTPSPTPTTMPTAMPTAQPLLPPQTPPPTNSPAPGAPSNPAPSPTSPPSNPTNPPAGPNPTSSPTQIPSTPNPTPMPTATPSPTATPQPTAVPTIPPMSPPAGPLNEFQSQVLDLVNIARSQGRNCGSDFFPAAPPVGWDHRIENAALLHSDDMARNQNFSHTGTDGSNAGDRLLMQSYNWRTWGENILVGLDDAPDAIDAWLGSRDHCRIIMNQSLQEVGAGVAQGIFQGFTSSYWTLLFATEN